MAKNILIFTGNGKGKSTAAFGMAVRAAGHGQRILIHQFMKSDTSTGELVDLRDKLGIDIRQMGLGFVPKPDHPKYSDHREAAQQAFNNSMVQAGTSMTQAFGTSLFSSSSTKVGTP